MEKEKLICNWCGKPAEVWWKYELLCGNCWEGVKQEEEVKKLNKFVKPKN